MSNYHDIKFFKYDNEDERAESAIGIGTRVVEPRFRELSNGQIKDTLTGEVGEPYSRPAEED